MKILYIFIILIIIIFLILLYITVNFGLKLTLMADRKDKKKMLDELLNRFGTDYRLYQRLPSEEVTIISKDKLKLKGVYHNLHPNTKKVVIINHGYTANRYVCYQFSDIFFEEGFNVLLIDMRSHGESEGKFASYGYNEADDLDCWVEWLKNKVGTDAYIGLHGQSMGAATVMLYGGSHPSDIKFVIEDCGFTSAKEEIKFQFSLIKIPFWPLYDLIRLKAKRRYKFNLNAISPKDAISNSSVPTLFIHGTKDTVVPSWMAETLYKSKHGEKDRLYLVDGADHMTAYYTNKNKYKEIVKNFLNNLH